VKAAVWLNSSASGTWHSVTFGRLYKDADDTWKTTDSFGRDELVQRQLFLPTGDN
jgi:hypothetical protein